MAPPVAAKLTAIVETETLTIIAGRIVSIKPGADGLEITWRPKGAHEAIQTPSTLLINCAGPNGDPAESSDPLLIDLLATGVARADACGLGLDVDDRARLIHRTGEAQSNLFAVGPITRGSLWEITSVPDIRLQAARCAEEVAHILNSNDASRPGAPT